MSDFGALSLTDDSPARRGMVICDGSVTRLQLGEELTGHGGSSCRFAHKTIVRGLNGDSGGVGGTLVGSAQVPSCVFKHVIQTTPSGMPQFSFNWMFSNTERHLYYANGFYSSVDDDNAFDVTNPRRKPRVVLHYLPSCGFCKAFKPIWNKAVKECNDFCDFHAICGSVDARNYPHGFKHACKRMVDHQILVPLIFRVCIVDTDTYFEILPDSKRGSLRAFATAHFDHRMCSFS